MHKKQRSRYRKTTPTRSRQRIQRRSPEEGKQRAIASVYQQQVYECIHYRTTRGGAPPGGNILRVQQVLQKEGDHSPIADSLKSGESSTIGARNGSRPLPDSPVLSEIDIGVGL